MFTPTGALLEIVGPFLDWGGVAYHTRHPLSGIIGDGVIDDRDALDKLVNTRLQPEGGELYVSGVLRIGSDLTIPANVRMKRGSPGRLAPDRGVTVTVNSPLPKERRYFLGGEGDFVLGTGTAEEAFPEWWGAHSNGTEPQQTTLALQAAYNSRLPISLGAGRYAYSTLVVDTYPLNMFGTGIDSTVLEPTAGRNIAINIGSIASVESVTLRNLWLKGNTTALGGVAFGSQRYYVAFVKIENVQIDGFTAADAYGVSLNSVQEFQTRDCRIKRNHTNVLRPNVGYCTSAVFEGIAGYLGSALYRGIELRGRCSDITFRSQVMEGNGKEALYQAGPGSNVVVEDCYIEGNLMAGGEAAITVLGQSGRDGYSKLTAVRNHFHDSDKANSAAPQLKLDYCAGSVIEQNDGLFGAGAIATTAHTQAHFAYNWDPNSAADATAIYRALPGVISWVDSNQTLRHLHGGDRVFDRSHFSFIQPTAPTISVNANAGKGAKAVLLPGATDTRGVLALSPGTGSRRPGDQLSVTFSRQYAGTPVVQLTPASWEAASELAVAHIAAYPSEDGMGFRVYANKAISDLATRWTYLVLG